MTFVPNEDKITFFARTNARGQNVPFGIKAKDRQRHMYVIGKTGMGKSTLLENMAAQDIQNGEGMAFIDPHGSAIEVLLEYVPEHRLDDVVYFAPFDMENPISFNIMEDVGEDTRHLVVSGLMSTFKKIWEDAWSARMEYILTNALLALIEYPDTTLLSVNRMLADKVYRDKVIDYIKDPAVKAYWVDEFNNYTERFAAEALPAIQNKIGQFTGNPLIRNIIGQPKSSFDVRKMMDEKKILLVNLSKGLVGETNADLLGSMLITKIYLAAMSRAELPPAQMKQMPNFYFYVDEFQSFANSTFANILSEARKYHLNLIIAHQYVAQMEEKIRDAVFGNVGTTVTFRVGPFDAEVLEPLFEPQFLATDLVNLGAYQIYLTLMIDGAGSAPFSATTLPPVKTPEKSHKFMVIKRSQQNYSKPRSVVEKIVTDLHTPEDRVEASAKGEGANNGAFTKPSGFFKVDTDKKFAAQKASIKAGLGNRPPKPGAKPNSDRPPRGADDRNKDADRPNDRTRSRTRDQSRDQSSSKSNESQRDKSQDTQRGGNNSRFGTDTASSPSSQRRGRPEDKSSSHTQSPEDLRAILARLANKETGNKPTDQKSPATTSEPKVAVGDSKHRADLQSALANVLKQPAQEAASPDKASAPPVEKTSQTDPISRSQTTQSDQSGAVPTPALTPKPTPAPTHNVFTPKSISADLPDAKPHSHKVVIERQPQFSIPTKQPELQDRAVDQPTSEPMPGTSRQPAFTPIQKEDQPDLQVVKKMLRHSGNDRLPGMD